MEIDRRTTLIWIGAGVTGAHLEAAQQHLHAFSKKPGEYKLQFFSPAEHETIDAVAGMIIPADAHSPGAQEARVAAYIDLVVAHNSRQAQTEWKSRLAAFDGLCRKQHGKPFPALDAAQRTAVLNHAARNEASPASDVDHFFVEMKHLTLTGYYTTEIGLLKDLGYRGNEVLGSFPGCQK